MKLDTAHRALGDRKSIEYLIPHLQRNTMKVSFTFAMDSKGILANNKTTLLKAEERPAAYIPRKCFKSRKDIRLHYMIMSHMLHRFISPFSKIFSSYQHETLFLFRRGIYQLPNITQLPHFRVLHLDDGWHVKCCVYQT